MEALSEIENAVGAENITRDPLELEYFSQDYFAKGENTLAVLRPQSIAMLAQMVRAATSNGLAIYPRGAGYSYTNGYLPTRPGVTLDLQSLNNIVEINERDMYVTVEAGCTWASLHEALSEKKLRTPFWGPFSGRTATVGGSLSQGSISWGSGKYGVSTESVLDLDVVAADGRIITTGVSGQPGHPPFFRNYGPDMTGLFCSDCGALGVKARATLRLIKAPAYTQSLSFGFQSFADAATAAAAVAREGVVSDNICVGADKTLGSMETNSLSDDLKALWGIGRTGAGAIDGLFRMAKVALAGRNFLKGVTCAFHYTVEGKTRRIVNDEAKIIRKAVGDLGVEIANTIPVGLRAEPFMEYDMLSPSGQRQLPPSTILPLSMGAEFYAAFFEKLKPYREAMARCSMTVVPAMATVGSNGFLFEPVMAWDDAAEAFHHRHSSEKVLNLASSNKPDHDARGLAGEIRNLLIETSFAFGGVHLQIGKVYPYTRDRNEGALNILKSVKAEMDPKNLMNPGAIGLPL